VLPEAMSMSLPAVHRSFSHQRRHCRVTTAEYQPADRQQIIQLSVLGMAVSFLCYLVESDMGTGSDALPTPHHKSCPHSHPVPTSTVPIPTPSPLPHDSTKIPITVVITAVTAKIPR